MRHVLRCMRKDLQNYTKLLDSDVDALIRGSLDNLRREFSKAEGETPQHKLFNFHSNTKTKNLLWHYCNVEEVSRDLDIPYDLHHTIRELHKKAESILDFGCGIGTTGLFLSQTYRGDEKKEFDVTLSDFPDSEFFRFAKHRAEKHGLKAEFIPFEIDEKEKVGIVRTDKKFDVVLLQNVIEHMDSNQIKAVLQNIRSLLTPSGRILMTANYKPHPTDFMKIMLTSHASTVLQKYDSYFMKGTVQRPKIKLMVLLPARGYVTDWFFRDYTDFVEYMHISPKIEFMKTQSNMVPLKDARQELLKSAIDWDADYVLWVDSDTQFSPRDFWELYHLQKPFASAAYKSRVFPKEYVIRQRNEKGDYCKITKVPDDVLLDVDGVGLGFALMRKDAIQALPKDKNLFDSDKVEINGKLMDLSEDLSFCNRIREAGFPILVDTGLIVGHIGGVIR